MRKRTILASLVAVAIVASLATIPGALAGGRSPAAASGYTAVLPAKRAVSGVWGGGCVAVAANDKCSATVTIFPNAPVDIEGQDMGTLAGLVENPECTGSDIDHPAAPAGVLCGYIDDANLVNIGKNGEGAYSVQFFPIGNGRRGFLVTWSAAAAGYSQIYGTWTYRAP